VALRLRRRSAAPEGVEPLPVRPRVTSPSAAPIRQLELTVLRRLDGLLAGDHLGLLPGHGTDRGEARPYEPGDDPRHIDWAVTARIGHPHVRDTIADHELEMWLVVDASSSLAFGTGLSDKHELAWAAAGAFALLAARGGNRVGAVRAAAEPTFVPARSGRDHVSVVLASLREPPADLDPGGLAAGIDMVRRLSRRRGMTVVVSDFLDAPTWEPSLRALAHTREVVAVEVCDPREAELPDVGLLSVTDPETGRRRLVDTSRDDIRARYQEAAAARRAALDARLAGCGADHLVLRTDRDWVLDLVRFVTGRRARVLAARAGR
jgi:uncharacterized protein (DUF58 family)